MWQISMKNVEKQPSKSVEIKKKTTFEKSYKL